MEEERRLLYVAITRAEKHCIMTSAKNRWRFGKMEFDTPSRFIKDIDSRFIHIESEFEVEASDDSFHTPYSASSFSDDVYRRYSDRMQNSRPVANQFQADPKPKITAPQRPEQAVDPFSSSFKRQLQQAGGNFKRVADAMTSGGRTATASSSSPDASGLQEGCTIEHQRFGIGTVLRLEGKGENRKATVAFRNAGTKQLLLKFARFKVLS